MNKTASRYILVPSSNINEEYALPDDESDIKIHFGDKKSKFTVQCGVFSKSGSLSYDSFS